MANDPNRVEIEIIASDKSFAKVEKDLEQSLKKGASKGADDGADEVSKIFSKKSLAIGGAIALGIGAAVKKAFDFTLAGEQIAQINGQFDMLAKRAGVSGQALKSALESASGGLVDDEEILKSANKALLELGDSAGKLPAIMAIAKQSTLLFGGSITENFERINLAISSGNTRSLRSIGLFIDQEKAIKDFAVANGVAANALSQTGKQQAILNAVLEKGGEAFKGVKDLKPVTTAFEKLKVSVGELGDAMAQRSQSAFGPFFEALVNGANRATQAITGMFQSLTGGRATPVVDTLKYLESQLTRIQGNLKGNYSDTVLTQMKSQAEMLKIQIEDLRKSQLKFGKDSEGLGANKKASLVDSGQEAKNKSAFQSEMLAARTQTIAIEEQKLALLSDYSERQVMIQQIRDGKIKLIADEFALKSEQIKQNELYSAQEKADLIVEIEKQKKERIRLLMEESLPEINTVGEGFNGIIGGMDFAVTEFVENSGKKFKELGQAMFQTIGQGAGNAFAAMGRAIAKGEDGLKAFAGAMLAALGQAAIQAGSMFIMMGLAKTLMGDASGVPLMAAGAALATIGGVMSAIGGGGDTGGGVSAGGGGLAQSGESMKPTEKQKETKVDIHVQGNILDRRETGLALVETINEFFNTSDGRIVRTGFA